MKRLAFCLITSAILFYPHGLFAEEIGISVEGYVSNRNGIPLNNVKVKTKDENAKYKTKTNPSGHYSLSLKQGKYTLKYKKTGYKTKKQDIDLSLATSTVYLEKVILTPVQSPEIDISGTWEGYYNIPELLHHTDIIMILEQNGDEVKGEAQTSDECPGEVSGTIQGFRASFIVHGAETKDCCESDMYGDATINKDCDFMSFTVEIKDHCYGNFKGMGEMLKKKE